MSILADRLLSKIRIEGDCYIWTAATDKDGYGKIRFQRRDIRAHRASYEENKGPIPSGFLVCHHCDTPGCIRPEHLFLGTAKHNTRDMMSKGRRSNHPPPHFKGEKNHKTKLTAEQVFEIRWYEATGESQRSLARRYRVSSPNISSIIKNETWQMECHD